MALENWRIDAWAVRDGAAFASRRAADSRDAQETAFIAVPDLEPVPIGRLSTALSATRRNFQTGLRNVHMVEIAFESIEQVVELVRRGYLASGLGPDGSSTPTPGEPPRLPDAGENRSRRRPLDDDRPRLGGGAHYEQVIKRTEANDRQWQREGLAPDSLARVADEATSAANGDAKEFTSVLLTLVDAYAEAVTIDWEQRIEQSQDPFDIKMLLDWYSALLEIGAWPSVEQMFEFLDKVQGRVGLDLIGNYWKHPWNVRMHQRAELPRQHLLSYAPCPRRVGWISGLTRLTDKLTLPMCVGDYFDQNPHLPELAPSVLGAMLLTSARFPSAFLVTQARFKGARLATALRWMAQEIPQPRLPDDAEHLVNEYAWQQLER